MLYNWYMLRIVSMKNRNLLGKQPILDSNISSVTYQLWATEKISLIFRFGNMGGNGIISQGSTNN